MAKYAIYDHELVEKDLYQFWCKHRLFELDKKNKAKKTFSIILPPPNVTGSLHLGHAWDGSLQDAIIRYKKLQGFRTTWIPGMDHAGIATQTKFEKVLQEKGVKRSALKDDEFLKSLFTWSSDQGKYIHEQWAKLGFALSYEHEVYSLDRNVSDLVQSSFKRLYDESLIYRDYKLVNWDVKLQTAISDIEVIRKPCKSKLYYCKYFIKGEDNVFLTVATTRPETIFVDACLFINPKDKRYIKYLNKTAINPINGNLMPILADEYVDIAFGTGVMKCTPAHDFNDYKLAQKHKIKNYLGVINADGTMNSHAKTNDKSFEHMERFIARDAIGQWLAKANKIVKVDEEYVSEIGYSERTDVIVEPFLSQQWFMKMQPIAKEVMTYLKKQPPQFIPSRFEQTMQQWLNNIEDWCISRQLVWGHRIPVWYHKQTKAICVGNAPKDKVNWTQDKDVLDTWYSSGLWPLVLTLNANSKEMRAFYPINMLVTGYDILFFWVARMFFQCAHLTKKIPLKAVLFHGLVRDEQGRKMSKSLNNGINPMEVIKKYGADALRMFLTSTATLGEDLRYSENKIQYYWSYINKLWNAHNFVSAHQTKAKGNLKALHPFNAWIMQEFNAKLKQINQNMEAYNLVVANKNLIDFSWEIFCNKYLELIKPLLSDKKYAVQTQLVLQQIFKHILIMLHPHMPFTTERMYLNLKFPKSSIMLESWPVVYRTTSNTTTIATTEVFLHVYSFIRDLRIKYGIKNDRIIPLSVSTKAKISQPLLQSLLTDFHITLVTSAKQSDNSTKDIATVGNATIEYTNDFVDATQQKAKLIHELERLDNEIKRSQTILNNPQFVQKAPQVKIKAEREKLTKYQAQYNEISHQLKNK